MIARAVFFKGRGPRSRLYFSWGLALLGALSASTHAKSSEMKNDTTTCWLRTGVLQPSFGDRPDREAQLSHLPLTPFERYTPHFDDVNARFEALQGQTILGFSQDCANQAQNLAEALLRSGDVNDHKGNNNINRPEGFAGWAYYVDWMVTHEDEIYAQDRIAPDLLPNICELSVSDPAGLSSKLGRAQLRRTGPMLDDRVWNLISTEPRWDDALGQDFHDSQRYDVYVPLTSESQLQSALMEGLIPNDPVRWETTPCQCGPYASAFKVEISGYQGYPVMQTQASLQGPSRNASVNYTLGGDPDGFMVRLSGPGIKIQQSLTHTTIYHADLPFIIAIRRHPIFNGGYKLYWDTDRNGRPDEDTERIVIDSAYTRTGGTWEHYNDPAAHYLEERPVVSYTVKNQNGEDETLTQPADLLLLVGNRHYPNTELVFTDTVGNEKEDRLIFRNPAFGKTFSWVRRENQFPMLAFQAHSERHDVSLHVEAQSLHVGPGEDTRFQLAGEDSTIQVLGTGFRLRRSTDDTHFFVQSHTGEDLFSFENVNRIPARTRGDRLVTYQGLESGPTNSEGTPSSSLILRNVALNVLRPKDFNAYPELNLPIQAQRPLPFTHLRRFIKTLDRENALPYLRYVDSRGLAWFQELRIDDDLRLGLKHAHMADLTLPRILLLNPKIDGQPLNCRTEADRVQHELRQRLKLSKLTVSYREYPGVLAEKPTPAWRRWLRHRANDIKDTYQRATDPKRRRSR